MHVQNQFPVKNMIELFSGRPAERRSSIEEKVYDILDMLGIIYSRADHSPASTIELCQSIEKEIDAPICKNLFLTNNTRSMYCLLLISSVKKYHAGKISRQLNSSRLSFASDEMLSEFLGLTAGSVSIMGLINDHDKSVTLAVDSDLLKNEYIGCHPCINTTTLKIKTEDILNKFIPYTGHSLNIIEA